MKQTAVEWLQEQLECFGNKHMLEMSWATLDELFEQAKAMEKEQIIDANIAGMEFIPADPNRYQEDAEQYHNETFKTNEK
jgi:hypothetical protein